MFRVSDNEGARQQTKHKSPPTKPRQQPRQALVIQMLSDVGLFSESDGLVATLSPPFDQNQGNVFRNELVAVSCHIYIYI